MTDSEAKRQFATQIHPEVLARIRATVVGLTGATGDQWTLSRATEMALAEWCSHMEDRHNGGEPWPPPRAGRLRAGRPLQG